MKNKKESFFKFTNPKMLVTIGLAFVFFVAVFFCGARHFFPISTSYACGVNVAVFVALPFRFPLATVLYLAIAYTIACVIVYLWRKNKR